MSKFVPWIIFAVFCIILFLSLQTDNKTLPSPFIDKKFPDIVVKDFYTDKQSEIATNFKGWTLVNFWASWCVACRAEHEMLENIKNDGVNLIGINYKDEKSDANLFLTTLGDPFNKVVFDYDGRAGIELGVYAIPESFLVDDKKIIRYKHLGEITQDIWHNKFKPIIDN